MFRDNVLLFRSPYSWDRYGIQTIGSDLALIGVSFFAVTAATRDDLARHMRADFHLSVLVGLVIFLLLFGVSYMLFLFVKEKSNPSGICDRKHWLVCCMWIVSFLIGLAALGGAGKIVAPVILGVY